MRPWFLSLAMLLLPTAAVVAAAPPRNGRAEARLAKMLAGRVAGPPVDCIEFHKITGADVVDRTAIVYHVGSVLYVNRPDAGGQSLNRGDILLTDTSLSKLCNVDVVRLLDQGQRVQKGFVNLGDFVPYTLPRAR